MIALALLFALILYGVLAWSVIRALGWLGRVCVFPASSTRILQGITLALFLLMPTWDIIPGRLYFQHLCQTEAGIKVFRTVEVEQSYFKADGRPDDRKLVGRYVQSSKRTPDFSSWAHITKIEGAIQDKETGDLLGVATDFSYYGGWVEATIAPMSPMTCPGYPNHVIHDIIWKEIFKQRNMSSLKGN
ncbi:MAG TPA: hypothetical protein PKV55_16205 [Nitrospira sp.]|nr:hypothetical protein [Nitrospira sp.]HNI69592.1 hypothetical protein [Nitrospira sp.]